MPKKTLALFCTLCLLLVALSGCAASAPSADHAYTPALIVTGDVKTTLELATTFEGYTPENVIIDERTYSCVSLLALLNAATVQGESLTVYISSPDGVLASLPYEQAGACYLTFCETGWTLLAPNHPPQANIKEIKHIVVAAQTFPDMERCLRIIKDNKATTYSYGALFTMDTTASLVAEGQPRRTGGDGTIYAVDAFTKRSLIPLSALTGKTSGTALAYLGNGEQTPLELDGFLEWRGNSADYVAANRRNRIKDVVGIWLDAPQVSNTSIRPRAMQALSGGRVLIIEIDGLGYDAYQWLIQNGCTTLKRFNTEKSRTVMPSISNVSLATILTGQTPDKTGVKERKDRALQCEDLFVSVNASGKTAAMVEGDSVLVTTTIDQILNADNNGNGSTDDEVITSALATLATGVDLQYVHFHGQDDVSHTYGPFSEQALQKGRELDGYLAQLLANFHGTVILCSDHGQHDVVQEGKLGAHGTFIPLDMTVPLGILKLK